MSAEERRRLTWEDATERFLDAAELKTGERPTPIEEACDRLAWKAFNAFSGEILLSSVKERLNVWAKAPVQCHNLLSCVLQNPCSDAVACRGYFLGMARWALLLNSLRCARQGHVHCVKVPNLARNASFCLNTGAVFLLH